MKIVYLNYLYDMKESSVGASVHVKELEKALQECGHKVQASYLNRFTSVEASVKSRARGFLKKKLWRYLNQINSVAANGRYFIKEWKIITKERPDVVLVRYHFLHFSLALVCLFRGIPFVLEVNAPMAYESRRFADHAVRLPLLPEIFEKFNLMLAEKVIVVSEELKSFYVKWHVPASKIEVVPNGVDVKKFHPAVSPQKIRSMYHLNGKTVLGFIGSFHYWHGVKYLVGFIKKTLSRYQDAAFLLVGPGPLKEELEGLLEEEKIINSVFFTGYVSHEEIPLYLAAMDIVLAPYPKLDLFYYSPLKLFEYMAAGKAIVASRIGQIEKLLTDRYDSILFEPDCVDELFNKSFELIEDSALRKALGIRARETVLRKYTWSHTGKRISDTLKGVVDNK
ncbi:MAG: glycosyltransferase family 4 protein [bacterium]